MKAISTVIIETAPAAAQLRRLLEASFPGMHIAGMAETATDGVRLICGLSPQLVFVGAVLKEGRGFDVLERLPGLTADVILLTDAAELAMEAYRFHAVGCLLKPLDEAVVLSAVQRCLDRIGGRIDGLVRQLLHTAQQESVGVPTMDGIEFVDSSQIVYLEAKGNYTDIRLSCGTTVLTSKRLCGIGERLPAGRFIRVHHSFIVNTRYIRKYYKGRGGRLLLQDGTSIPVSVRRKEEFLRLFE